MFASDYLTTLEPEISTISSPYCHWQSTSCSAWNIIYIFVMSTMATEKVYNQTLSLIFRGSKPCFEHNRLSQAKIYVDRNYMGQKWETTESDFERAVLDKAIYPGNSSMAHLPLIQILLSQAIDDLGSIGSSDTTRGNAIIIISDKFRIQSENDAFKNRTKEIISKSERYGISPIGILDLPFNGSMDHDSTAAYHNFTDNFYALENYDELKNYSNVIDVLSPCFFASNPPDAGLSSTEIALIAIFSIVLAVLLIIIVGLCCWKRRRVHPRRIENIVLPNRSTESGNECETPTTHDDDRYLEMPVGTPVKTDEWELRRDRLYVYLRQKLGSGAFCNVFKGYIVGKAPISELTLSLTNIYEECDVAVKMLHDHRENLTTDLLQEIDFMKTLGYHPHVVNMLGCVTVGKPVCLITELCAMGDLLNLVRNCKDEILGDNSNSDLNEDIGTKLTFKHLLSFSWQISDGMAYLSAKGYIHRDVAARNVLVNSDFTAKISDFGLCRRMDSGIYTSSGGRLPIKWMALESLNRAEFTTKSDVWSFGVLLYEVYSFGQVPFGSIQPANMVEYLESGNRLKQPPNCPDEIYEIMSLCWKTDTEERPGFETVREKLAEILDKDSDKYGYILTVNNN